MLSRWLTTFLVACALLAQGAALAHTHDGDASGIGVSTILCKALGTEGGQAPDHDVSSKHKCADCILSAELVALGAVLLALVLAPEFSAQIKVFASQRVSVKDRRTVRPPSRAPPVFS